MAKQLGGMKRPKPTYPKDHEAGMRVPEGGSSCASCKWLSRDRCRCTNDYFIKWHGNPILPEPADEYCSDWWEAAKGVLA